jgi:NADPH:quinone reductase-like Zn-dependent oxidoreductase
MKQLVLTKYGLSEKNFEWKDIAPIVLEKGSVLVEVKAAGVSFTDVIIALGLYDYQRKNFPLPLCLGFEFSGIVSESMSSNFSVGDRVVGIKKFGAWATHIKVTEGSLLKIPDNCTF